jgi:thioredoxin reductase (NADPH)
VIVATGASPKKLGCLGEKEYWGKGVNTCATCDAPLYEGREVVVVGGGNSAIAESFALSKYAKKVTIVQVGQQLTATDPLKDKTLERPNIGVLYNKKVLEILGDGQKVVGIKLEDQKDKSISEYKTQGVFIAIGMKPNTELFLDYLEVNKSGYLLWKEGMQTSLEGVFSAGDVSDFRYRQAITASGQGCAAALECERFLQK